MGIKKAILDLMNKENYSALSLEDLLNIFEFKKKAEIRAFSKVLEDMEKEGSIIKEDNKYLKLEDSGYIKGSLQGHQKGFAFLLPEDKSIKDIFISIDNMLDAFSGDEVLVEITKEGSENKSTEGKVVKILERKNKEIVGIFQKSRSFGFVVPDDKRINYDVFISKKNIGKAKNGQKVVVEIIKWPMGGRNPEGIIKEIIGFPEEKGVDILSLIKQTGLPYVFPKEVIKEAKAEGEEVLEEDLLGREDLRSLNIFTIDGKDAKDLDDAISIFKNEKDNYVLGVHIADVSHYVKEKTALDKEAYKRGNSVYLLDRVIPMLPKELSNGICSLNPKVDRLCLSVFMEIDNNGDVLYHKIVESVINSKNRLIYDNVSDFIEGKKIDESIKTVEKEIILLDELAKILYSKRERRGSIDFDIPETEIILDQDGRAKWVGARERRVADKIIEECMLICNETVAENMYWSEIPFLYRIHEEPDMERMMDFNRFIHNFGYSIKPTQEIHPKELQKLSKEIKGKKEEVLINTLMLRSLKKAIYSEDAEIHFGLATDYYTHFTAPIRRYSDLLVHRIVKAYITGSLSSKKQDRLADTIYKTAEHISKTERKAEMAERDVYDLKKAEYMADKIGNTYEGIISSITHFGIFVSLENTIEGLIRYEYMRDDYYLFDEKNYIAIGESKGKKYMLGDKVKIKVINADIYSRTIDFIIVDENKEV